MPGKCKVSEREHRAHTQSSTRALRDRHNERERDRDRELTEREGQGERERENEGETVRVLCVMRVCVQSGLTGGA